MRVLQLLNKGKREGVYFSADITKTKTKCRPIHISKQPKGKKYYTSKTYNLPIEQLTEPDMFTGYSNRPSKWLSCVVDKNFIETAIAFLKENNKDIHDDLNTLKVSNIIVASLSKRDLDVGQIWKHNKDEITITKKFGDFLVIKNKYGDRDRVTFDDLLKTLSSGYKLQKAVDIKSLKKALTKVLKPFLGPLLLGTLLMTVTNWIKKGK